MINPETSMQEGEYSCLSFNNYGYVAEIADKISNEIQAEEGDFDFSLVCENADTSIAEFIYDVQTKFQQPIFPVFNRDLLLNDVSYESYVKGSKSEDVDGSIRIPLRDLFQEDGESETIPPGTYCVWKPKISEALPGKCKKSKSTGFVSKRWPKIRDLLRRSNSEGKEEDSFVFLTPKKITKNSSEVVKTAGKLKQTKGSHVTGGEKGSPAAAASHLAPYRAGKEVDKNRRKSYLPYRQHLFAIGLGRSYRPF